MPLIESVDNFYTAEVRCNETGKIPEEENYIPLAKKLQRARDVVGLPFICLSWYRHEDHSLSIRRREQGKGRSEHEFGHAVDIRIPGWSEDDMFTLGYLMGFSGVGYYPNQGFSHWDMRENETAYWMRTQKGVYKNINPQDYLVDFFRL